MQGSFPKHLPRFDYVKKMSSLTLFYPVEGAFLPPSRFFAINLFRKQFFTSNQLDFGSNFITNNPVKGSSQILRFAKVTPEVELFCSIFDLNNVTRRFCDVTTSAFYDVVSKKNLCTKFEPPTTSLQNDFIFRKYGSGVTMMSSSTQNQFLKRILVNTNPLAKFGVPMPFGLGVR